MGAVDAEYWLLAAILAPFARLLIYTPILWLVRKLKPEWERVLFQKIPND